MKLLRPTKVEERYDIPVGKLAKWRCSGEGPEFLKVGAFVYYEEEAIERWLATKRRASTSDTGTVDGPISSGLRRAASAQHPHVEG
jgi:hypothetical protein